METFDDLGPSSLTLHVFAKEKEERSNVTPSLWQPAIAAVAWRLSGRIELTDVSVRGHRVRPAVLLLPVHGRPALLVVADKYEMVDCMAAMLRRQVNLCPACVDLLLVFLGDLCAVEGLKATALAHMRRHGRAGRGEAAAGWDTPLDRISHTPAFCMSCDGDAGQQLTNFF